MAWTQGWWTLSTEGVDLRDLSEAMREHIADSIKNGNTEGQIFEEVFQEEFKPGDRICLKGNDALTGTVLLIYPDGYLRVRFDDRPVTGMAAPEHVRKVFDGS
jgi:hypothetical protein